MKERDGVVIAAVAATTVVGPKMLATTEDSNMMMVMAEDSGIVMVTGPKVMIAIEDRLPMAAAGATAGISGSKARTAAVATSGLPGCSSRGLRVPDSIDPGEGFGPIVEDEGAAVVVLPAVTHLGATLRLGLTHLPLWMLRRHR